MKTRSAVVGSGVTAAAAVLGNVFVGKEALSWFRGLRPPRFQLPMPGFVSVAAAYYVIMAVVLARGIDRRDAGAIAWAVAVWPGTRRGTVCCSVGEVPVRPSSACWRSWCRWAGCSDRSGRTSTPAGSCCPIRPMRSRMTLPGPIDCGGSTLPGAADLGPIGQDRLHGQRLALWARACAIR